MEGVLLSPGGPGCQATIWAWPCSVRWYLYLEQDLVSLLGGPASALPSAPSTGSVLPPSRAQLKLGSEPRIHKTQSLGHRDCPASMTLHWAPTLEYVCVGGQPGIQGLYSTLLQPFLG